MPEDDKKTLPKDVDSDYSLPGRFEESNSEYFVEENFKPKPKNKTIFIIIAAFIIISSGFFSYYFINQNEIDSQIIQNTTNISNEEYLASQYGVGEYGSKHAHAAIVVFIDGDQINFGHSLFQLTSKYIHFENHNPYLVHMHATNVPLDMLFASLGIRITTDCITWNYDELSENKTDILCNDKDKSLIFYVNGEKYHSDISHYVFDHNDRILISYGDSESISEHLEYLESLEIADIPKKTPQSSGNTITI